MSFEAQLETYKEILLAHIRNPKNLGKLSGATHIADLSNPKCGDHIRVAVVCDNGVLANLKYEIRACGICTASASIMSEKMRGREVSFSPALFELVKKSLMDLPDARWPNELIDLQPLSHIRSNRSRTLCALLPWLTLERALENHQ